MKIKRIVLAGMIVLGLHVQAQAQVFDSGSTGADGPFNPLVNTILALPPNGVFNYTTINIPAGVTVTFLKNSANTPVTFLASSNVTIDGIINIGGAAATASGSAGDGNIGDDGQPGIGGPGGFDGGFGGLVGTLGNIGGNGQGPGGGSPGVGNTSGRPSAGAGGGFGTVGENAQVFNTPGGPTYGTAALLPLIGGSGGSGAAGGENFAGSGGGGGGGAILIASSGTITVTGSIFANGGNGGGAAGTGAGNCGGGGSGGGIRLVADTISGNGTIQANSGLNGTPCNTWVAGDGGHGRIRIEANTITRTSGTVPVFTFDSIAPLFVPGNPTLSITAVDGVPAPANPTGSADITLPTTTVNPVSVDLAASGIPIGTAIEVTVTPTIGNTSSAVSTALAGTEAASTASADVTLPDGPSVLSAAATFTLTQTASLGFPVFVEGEKIEKVRIAAVLGGKSSITYITESGKEVPASSLR